MSPIHRPGFESAPVPEFAVSPFVIPSPSRDETRTRNLHPQVPRRLAAGTGDLNRGANTAVCRCVCKVNSPLPPHPHERRAQTDWPSALAQLRFQRQPVWRPKLLAFVHCLAPTEHDSALLRPGLTRWRVQDSPRTPAPYVHHRHTDTAPTVSGPAHPEATRRVG